MQERTLTSARSAICWLSDGTGRLAIFPCSLSISVTQDSAKIQFVCGLGLVAVVFHAMLCLPCGLSTLNYREWVRSADGRQAAVLVAPRLRFGDPCAQASLEFMHSFGL
jgi:hypothetical protein